jgi:hypothetical protein
MHRKRQDSSRYAMPAAWFLLASESPTGKPKGNLESLSKPTFDSHILVTRS